MPSPNANAVIVERIEALRCDLMDNTSMVRALSTDYTKFREFYAGEHTKVVLQTEAAHRRLDEHDKKIDELYKLVTAMSIQITDIVRTLKVLTGVLIFLAVTIGGLALDYFWGILVK